LIFSFKEGDITLLEEIAGVTRAASLCALGKTAADPLRNTLRYFRDEYEGNIAKKKNQAVK
jgi:NADH:ubiquinone oxidoreductase subunit F (NADH-binding)